jgi:diaminohydroxyphosphoribosylaminopyrimidine deaminase/5-amino-6-(5-phosphoribosylamino)uracil reductase
MMSTPIDNEFMMQAIRLAARGLYSTDPNPRVGCVLVKDGQVIGQGWHEQAGSPHAEINALTGAGDAARGATAYVTLEPCCHQGKTPPCSDALIKAGITRVVAAMEDPNPRVAGKGSAALRQAGIVVETGLLQAQAEQLNPGFIQRMKTGRPWVRCKLAMSLDGRTAMASGESRWISGEAARADVQRLRARSSAIMTGIGTVIADDPSLNVRLDNENDTPVRQPVRVILDSKLRTPKAARLLGLSGETIIFTREADENKRAALASDNVTVINQSSANGQLDLGRVLDELGKREINEVQLEAGATLSGAMLDAGLVDELVIYMAPHLMGDGGRGLFHLPGLTEMQQCIELSISDIRAIGPDIRITATCHTERKSN